MNSSNQVIGTLCNFFFFFFFFQKSIKKYTKFLFFVFSNIYEKNYDEKQKQKCSKISLATFLENREIQEISHVAL